MRADIRFRDGSVIRCVGRVVDRQSAPWTDEADMRRHINSIPGLEVVRVIEESPR